LRQWANHVTRRGKDHEPLDLVALVRQWAAQASASEAGALEPVALAVMHAAIPKPRAAPDDAPSHGWARAMWLGGWEAQRVMQEAVAAVQAAQATWTEADLIRHLGERLPAAIGAMSAADAAALLPALARQALAKEAVLLSAPEWPKVPGCLRRASGEHVRPAWCQPVRLYRFKTRRMVVDLGIHGSSYAAW
jgi:hypothetical protein